MRAPTTVMNSLHSIMASPHVIQHLSAYWMGQAVASGWEEEKAGCRPWVFFRFRLAEKTLMRVFSTQLSFSHTLLFLSLALARPRLGSALFSGLPIALKAGKRCLCIRTLCWGPGKAVLHYIQ